MSITRDDALNWIKAVAGVIGENSTYLTELDAAIGDADHGANMDRGFKAVMNKLPEISDKDIGTMFKTIGMTLISTVGGAGGTLAVLCLPRPARRGPAGAARRLARLARSGI